MLEVFRSKKHPMAVFLVETKENSSIQKKEGEKATMDLVITMKTKLGV